MKQLANSIIVKTGLAIFAMLFGAGNLIFPSSIGILSGNLTYVGLIGFILTGVLIPLTGLLAMVFFDGNYHTFFERIGKVPGKIFIFFCMLVIGPMLVMPRIITFSYEIMRPFIGNYISLLVFSTLFILITFLCTYKKNALIDLIGTILSPLLLVSLFIIFIIGFFTGHSPSTTHFSAGEIFKSNLLLGYNTLDLLGTIFFAYIILSILRATTDKETATNKKKLAKITILSSLIAGLLLALVYIGMGYLGSWHGQGLELLDEGKMLIQTLLRILGPNGALIISASVFLACLTTIIALASVVSEYIHNDLSFGKISYINSLIIVLIITGLMSQFELGPILEYSKPLINIAYPVLIVLTFCNIGYKLWGFPYVKVPVLGTLILSSFWFGPNLINMIKKNININLIQKK